ncbi:hypothetical protein GCM10027614_38960 [Micromonospora vulcania]
MWRYLGRDAPVGWFRQTALGTSRFDIRGVTMRLTKYAHSCLRVEHDGGVLVVDPGVFSDPAALDSADAVLVTHEHPDHLNIAAVRRQLDQRPFPIHGPASLTKTLGDAAETLSPVTPGESFTAAGVAVRAYGDGTR